MLTLVNDKIIIFLYCHISSLFDIFDFNWLECLHEQNLIICLPLIECYSNEDSSKLSQFTYLIETDSLIIHNVINGYKIY